MLSLWLQRTWSALNLGKKPALRGNKHETMFGSALSPSQDNRDGQSFNDFSSDEDDMTCASDVTTAKGISIAKSLGGEGAPNTGCNEQDVEVAGLHTFKSCLCQLYSQNDD